MPKLSKQDATAVKNTEAATSFAPLPPGLYDVVLRKVEAKQGQKGPYWLWEFEIPEGFEHEGRRFWQNTSLSVESRPFLKRTFDAFGASPDVDTDNLIGTMATVRVSVRTIRGGDKDGQQTNKVDEVLPYVDPEDREAAI